MAPSDPPCRRTRPPPACQSESPRPGFWEHQSGGLCPVCGGKEDDEFAGPLTGAGFSSDIGDANTNGFGGRIKDRHSFFPVGRQKLQMKLPRQVWELSSHGQGIIYDHRRCIGARFDCSLAAGRRLFGEMVLRSQRHCTVSVKRATSVQNPLGRPVPGYRRPGLASLVAGSGPATAGLGGGRHVRTLRTDGIFPLSPARAARRIPQRQDKRDPNRSRHADVVAFESGG